MDDKKGQLTEILGFLVRGRVHLKWILLVSVLIGLAGTVYGRIRFKPRYRSEAIALIRPQIPTIADEDEDENGSGGLLTQPLNITDYVILLKSEGVLSQVAKQYNDERESGNREDQITVARLRKWLFVREQLELKTPYAVRYAPTVMMRVSAPSQEMAHRLAEIWVEVVENQTHDVTFSAKEEVLKYLNKEHEGQRQTVNELKDKLNQVKDKSAELTEKVERARVGEEEAYARETVQVIKEASDRWDREIAKKAAEFNVPLLEAQIAAATEQRDALEAEREHQQTLLIESRAELERLETEKGSHPDLLVVAKAITDDALWNAKVQELGERGAAEEVLKLRSEQINTIAQSLSQRIAEANVLAEAIPDEIKELGTRIDALERKIAGMQGDFFEKEAELEILEQAKTAEVKQIEIEREYGLKELERRTEIDVDKITRKRTALEERITRDFDTQLDVFTNLAKVRLEAQLTIANSVEEFQIISPPTFPEEVEPVNPLIPFVSISLIAFVALLFAVVAVLLVKETVANIKAAAQGA